MSYKEQVQARAEELAHEVYNTDYADLPIDLQYELDQMAEDDYEQAYSDWCDQQYEIERERRMGL